MGVGYYISTNYKNLYEYLYPCFWHTRVGYGNRTFLSINVKSLSVYSGNQKTKE